MEEEEGERKQKDQLDCIVRVNLQWRMMLRTTTKRRHLQWVQEVLVVLVVHYYLADPEEAAVKYLQYIKY